MDTGNSGDNILSVICLAIISLILIVICGLICYCFSNFSYLMQGGDEKDDKNKEGNNNNNGMTIKKKTLLTLLII